MCTLILWFIEAALEKAIIQGVFFNPAHLNSSEIKQKTRNKYSFNYIYFNLIVGGFVYKNRLVNWASEITKIQWAWVRLGANQARRKAES